MTNAHVVAGESDTTVEADGAPPMLNATTIYFDPSNDVAVLRVPGLQRRALDSGPAPAARRRRRGPGLSAERALPRPPRRVWG